MSKIAAGIVLYNPNMLRLKENIDAIYSQVELVVLIDNNSENINLVEEEFNSYSKILIIKNESNCGIARALNQIIGFCLKNEFKWVLTLDQDSVCQQNLMQEYKKYIDISGTALISPIIKDRNKEFKLNNKNKDYDMTNKCITSGTLTNTFIWKEIGGFDELMFIDLVDFEYCERVIKKGFNIIQVNTIILLHEIGEITKRKFIVWDVEVKNHSAFRKFYMAQNILYYAKKHYKLGNVTKAYLRIIKLLIVVLLYETDKWNKCRNILKGMLKGHLIYDKYKLNANK